MSGPNLHRRALLSGSVLAIAATAGAATTTAAAAYEAYLTDGTAAPVADAELLRVCGDFDAIEVELDALDWDNAAHRADALSAKQAPLLDRMCAIQATTLAGLRARAETIVRFVPDLKDELDEGYWDKRMVAALLRDLVDGSVA